MKRAMIAASTAVSALALAPGASAAVTVSCPTVTIGKACTFEESLGTGAFLSVNPANTTFDETFTLVLTAAYRLSITATNTLLTPISFTTSELAGLGPISFGGVANDFVVGPGTYSLHFIGTTGAKAATYSGTIDISAIPELTTWAMLVAGFGVVGLALRRKQNIRVSFA